MALILKPHTWTVKPALKATDHNRDPVPTGFGAQVTVTGQVQPLDAETSMKESGALYKNAAKFFMETTDTDSHPPGSEITFDGDVYVVKEPFVAHTAMAALAYATVIAEKMQYRRSPV